MRTWIKALGAVAIVGVGAVAFAVRHHVHELSDAAASAHVAMTAEHAAWDALGQSIQAVAGSHALGTIDTLLLPALDRSVTAIGTAIDRVHSVDELDSDEDSRAYIEAMRTRAQALRTARDKLIELHGHPDEQLGALRAMASSLANTP